MGAELRDVSKGTNDTTEVGEDWLMSKYHTLWEYVCMSGGPKIRLTFDEVRAITGFEIDHSFLNYKRELVQYGYQVGKISLKEKTVAFNKLD